jgi:NAD(P)-dependent dehydrogenase (short-subunit alcohol dehydrogenase family)
MARPASAVPPDPPPVGSLLDLSGRVAVITGASGGIGRFLARRFAEAGAAVVAHYHSNESIVRATLSEIADAGGRGIAAGGDLTRFEDADALIRAAVEAYGRLDILINNAGQYPVSSLRETSPEQWDEVIAANLNSVSYCTRAAATEMIAQSERGSIVNIASIESASALVGHSHYSAAKAGVIALTRGAAYELGPHEIRVNAVSPGLIWREGLERDWPDGVDRWLDNAPLGRLGRPEDVGDACIFLASPAARWITGAVLTVDGGVSTRPPF